MNPNPIRMGSLEEVERKRLAEAAANGGGAGGGAARVSAGEAALQTAIAVGHVNLGATQRKQVLELSETSLAAQDEHAKLLQRVEAERRARTIVVPTAVPEVKARLRALGEPITLFGELVADRRERLRRMLAEAAMAGEESAAVDAQVAAAAAAAVAAAPAGQLQQQHQQFLPPPQQQAKQRQQTKAFYTPASAELQQARAAIADFSFGRGFGRLAGLKRARAGEGAGGQAAAANAAEAAATAYCDRARRLVASASQIADDRPTQCCRWSPDGSRLASAAWSGEVKVWRGDDDGCAQLLSLKGHEERATDVHWHPGFGGGGGGGGGVPARCGLASASADGTARLWPTCADGARAAAEAAGGDAAAAVRLNKNGVPVLRASAVVRGHADRVSAVRFLPGGRHFATASYDKTWRLWDIERCSDAAAATELLLQEGHSCEVYALAVQGDGALLATGDLGGIGHVWDLRSGKSVYQLRGGANAAGHSKKLLSLSWSPDGRTLASGSEDHTVRVWDLRKRQCAATIAAHSALITSVCFAPTGAGELLATAAHDGLVKLWRRRDWCLHASLAGHDGKVMCVDFASQPGGRAGGAPKGPRLVSAGFDRTFKVWAADA